MNLFEANFGDIGDSEEAQHAAEEIVVKYLGGSGGEATYGEVSFPIAPPLAPSCLLVVCN